MYSFSFEHLVEVDAVDVHDGVSGGAVGVDLVVAVGPSLDPQVSFKCRGNQIGVEVLAVCGQLGKTYFKV